MNRILITGDSYACGEWNYNEKTGNNTATSILDKLLIDDGHHVIVDCHPAGNDYQSLASVNKYINSVDTVIYFKTCSSRILENYDVAKQLMQGNNYDLFRTLDQLDNQVYRTLEELKQRVFLIGGMSKITKDVDVEYVLPSVLEYLTNKTFPQYELGMGFIATYRRLYKEKLISIADFNQVLNKFGKFSEIITHPDNHILRPDGGHPNREGITILYNLIRDKI